MEYIPDKRCLVCNEVISNPICPDCINEEIRDWLADRKLDLIEDVNEVGSTKCILCGNNIRICPSCYTNEIYDLVRKQYPSLANEFKIHFDFDLQQDITE